MNLSRSNDENRERDLKGGGEGRPQTICDIKTQGEQLGQGRELVTVRQGWRGRGVQERNECDQSMKTPCFV